MQFWCYWEEAGKTSSFLWNLQDLDVSFHRAWILLWPFSTWTTSFIKVLKSVSLTLINHFSRVSAWEFLLHCRLSQQFPHTSCMRVPLEDIFRLFRLHLALRLWALSQNSALHICFFCWKFWIFVNLGYFLESLIQQSWRDKLPHYSVWEH